MSSSTESRAAGAASRRSAARASTLTRAAGVIVDGSVAERRAAAPAARLSVEELMVGQCAELDPAATTKDDVAFWLYTSGTTGPPKAAVHLQHDMVVCCETYEIGRASCRERVSDTV